MTEYIDVKTTMYAYRLSAYIYIMDIYPQRFHDSLKLERLYLLWGFVSGLRWSSLSVIYLSA